MKTVTLLSAVLLFFLWGKELSADKNKDYLILDGNETFLDEYFNVNLNYSQELYESSHDFSVYDILQHKFNYLLFSNQNGESHFSNFPVIFPIPVKFQNIDFFINHLNTSDLAELPINIFKDLTYAGTNLIPFGQNSNQLVLPQTINKHDTTYLNIKTKVIFSPDKLATSFGIVDETNENYFYGIKANYWQGTKKISSTIPNNYEGNESNSQDLDYTHISTLGKVGFKDKNSRLTLSYLLLNNRRKNILFQPSNSINSFYDNYKFSQLIDFSFDTKTNTNNRFHGNIYYRNNQAEIDKSSHPNTYRKQDLDEFGARMAYDILYNYKKKYDIRFGLKYSNIESKYYSNISSSIKNENLTFESYFLINKIFGNISYSLSEYSDNQLFEKNINSLNFNINWNISSHHPYTTSRVSLYHNTSPTLWWMHNIFNEIIPLTNTHSTKIIYKLFSVVHSKHNGTSQYFESRNVEVSLGTFNTQKAPKFNIEDNSIFFAGSAIDLPLELPLQNIFDIDLNYQHIFNPEESLYYIPNFAANLTLFNLIKDWKLYYSLNFQYSYRYQENENFKYQDYMLLNAMVSYELFDNFNLSLNFKNLLDDYYELYPGLPANGRTIEFGFMFSPQVRNKTYD
jgi:hypothetical protein